ncbi:hypothetical protein ABZX65_21230 [Streptomyces sp. NPDC003300]|uniref:hypothetical protein n=1 Tax=unclassified Streptomyces TaxID=2593676 RepID=UPI0033A9D6DF
MHERFGTEPEDVPSYPVLRRVWREWFGSGRGRQRNEQAIDLVSNNGHGYVLIDRPGKVVALDTTVLPVMVRESVYDEPVKVHLTIALCAYTHSICAFRLTLVSDTSVDVAMLLRDVMLPLPMRDDWGKEMEWPYPGLPAAVVAEFAGHEVAGLPFFEPETVTTDHGSVYRNHHLVQVQEDLGCNILPSRVLRPEDKNCVERAFGSIRSLLFEWLPGYTGVDVADRGADPEGDAVLTVPELEYVIATWIVGTWQRRRLSDHAPHWDPGGDHSPNSLLAAAFSQGASPWRSRPPTSTTRSSPSTRSTRSTSTAASRSAGFGMTARPCGPTGASGRAAAASGRPRGSSTATPATGARSSSRTRSPTTGTPCAGPACRRTTWSPPSATSASPNCCGRSRQPDCSPGPTRNCYRNCSP